MVFLSCTVLSDGAGGLLYNQAMERFMPEYDDRLELAPRDVVARSIYDQMLKRDETHVLLDISHRKADEVRTGAFTLDTLVRQGACMLLCGTLWRSRGQQLSCSCLLPALRSYVRLLPSNA